MPDQIQPTPHSDGIERMARRLWEIKCECYQWPQSAVSWERTTEMCRDAHRAQAISLFLEYGKIVATEPGTAGWPDWRLAELETRAAKWHATDDEPERLRGDLVMPERTQYIAGLAAAERACVERSRRHREEVARWPASDDESRTACLRDALEAMECALEIKSLREAAMKEQANA